VSKKLKYIMTILFTTILALTLFVLYFGRTPLRLTPSDANIVSPANGKIIALDEISTEHVTFFKEGIQNELEARGVTLPAHVIVIQMNLKNVHVQRSPITGKVLSIEHIDGKFKNALFGKNRDQLVNLNEKNLTVISNDQETVGVIQVAGIVARRIKSYVSQDESVIQGQKIGFIALGSQVVLVIPQARTLQVKVGDIVVDGETIIAQ
jgi:phosphatidylserine decarboxylase